MGEAKTSYLSPASAVLEVSAVRSLEPSASITLDLGIPNFTTFSIKFPLPEEKGAFPELAGEALGVMLDEMAAFMLSMGYRQGVIAKVYALAMGCYRGMQGQEVSQEREPTIGTVRGEFPLPTEFVNETQKQVVTAAGNTYEVVFSGWTGLYGQISHEEVRGTFPSQRKALAFAGEEAKKLGLTQDAWWRWSDAGEEHVIEVRYVPRSKVTASGEQQVVTATNIRPKPPRAVMAFADEMRQEVGADQCGDSWVVSSSGNEINTLDPRAPKKGWWVETHTIGCRNAADEDEEDWWDSHFTIYDEYAADGMSTLVGDPSDGKFVSITPWGSGKQAGKKVERIPVQRRMEFVPERPKRPSKSDVLRAIRMYRFQSIKNTPRPLYLVVYDNMGNPKGTLSLGPGFANDLLKMQYGKRAGTLGLAGIIRDGGGIFKGVGEDGRGGELAYFDNPANSSTLVLPVDDNLTPEAVRRKLEWNNALFSRKAAATCEFCKAPSVGCVVNYAQPEGPFLGSAVHVCEEHKGKGEDPQASQVTFVSNRWERRPGEGRVPYPEFSKRRQAGQGVPSIGGKNLKDAEQAGPTSKGKIRTLSGRIVEPPIQKATQSERGVKANIKAVDRWLIEEAKAEAKAKKDDWNLDNFSKIDPKQITPAERTDLNVYLFGKEEVGLPKPELKAPKGKGKPPIPLEKAVRADYFDEQGYWAGEGHAASGVLPVCTSTGRVCLAWRSPGVNPGNCWGTIGGAVKEGMGLEESARHELAEETGYRGGLTLHPAYVFKSGRFQYHNFIGEAGHEFGLRPQRGSAWETEALEWGGLDEWLREARAHPGDFHPGVLALLRESDGLIRSICDKAEGRKA